MSQKPFFVIEWKPLNHPQFLPAPGDAPAEPFFSIAWRPTLGFVHYPWPESSSGSTQLSVGANLLAR